MMNDLKKCLLRHALWLTIALTSVGHAATVVSIPSEFTSPFIETWESFPLGILTGYPPATIAMMNGLATATGSELVTYIPGEFGPSHFGLGNFTAKVHDGNQGFGVSSIVGNVTFSFDTPIAAFGGFWGIASNTEPIIVTFLDGQNNVLAQTQFLYGRPNNDGTLEWHGWGIDTPVSKVNLTGAFFVNDSLRVTQVPEPSCPLLLAIGLAAIFGFDLLLRQYRGDKS